MQHNTHNCLYLQKKVTNKEIKKVKKEHQAQQLMNYVILHFKKKPQSGT